MKNIYLISSALLLFVLGCDTPSTKDSKSTADEKNKKNLTTRRDEREAEFITGAIDNKMAEMKLAELASTKSSNKSIRIFASQVVNDHTEAIAMLQAYATRRKIATPVAEGEKTRKEINRLFELQSPDFDKKWCDEYRKRYRKEMNDLETRRRKAEDLDLKHLIDQMLADLRAHKMQLDSLQASL